MNLFRFQFSKYFSSGPVTIVGWTLIFYGTKTLPETAFHKALAFDNDWTEVDTDDQKAGEEL